MAQKFNKTCEFCRIIKNKDFDYEDQYAVAFEPLNPVTPGHLLIVPKDHTPDAGHNTRVFARTAHFAGQLAHESRYDYNLITSSGPFASQTVYHLHIHFVPRREEDGLLLPWGGIED